MTKIFCDSSTREACYVIEGQEPVITPYPKPVTVNVGEYRSVILALEKAIHLKLEQVLLLTDSLLVVNQVRGAWKCRKEHLLPLRDRIRELLLFGFDYEAIVRWVPREENIAGKVLE